MDWIAFYLPAPGWDILAGIFLSPGQTMFSLLQVSGRKMFRLIPFCRIQIYSPQMVIAVDFAAKFNVRWRKKRRGNFKLLLCLRQRICLISAPLHIMWTAKGKREELPIASRKILKNLYISITCVKVLLAIPALYFLVDGSPDKQQGRNNSKVVSFLQDAFHYHWSMKAYRKVFACFFPD